MLVVVFFVITAPVGAHMIGRAAYLTGVPLWEGTIIDEHRQRGDRPRPTAVGERARAVEGSEDRASSDPTRRGRNR